VSDPAPLPPSVSEMRPGALPPAPPEYIDHDPSTRWLRLDNNTNPRTHPVASKVRSWARTSDLNRYGTAWGARLRSALSNFYGLPASHFLVGNGSDSILDALARAFLGPGRVAARFTPGYDLHATFALRTGATLREWRLTGDLQIPGELSWLRGVDLLFVASPHNPTGERIDAKRLIAFAGRVRGIVAVDEAYAEFAGPPIWSNGALPPNLVFIRTFSKAWGLAGLRVGYAVLDPALAARVDRFRDPFALGSLPEAIASGALGEVAFVRESVAIVRSERRRLTAALRARGFEVFPSRANFVLTYPPTDGMRLRDALRARGILVRVLAATDRCSAPVRVTVGLPEETDELLGALDRILVRVPTGDARPERLRTAGSGP
jgi:histidinol-phosphate aminotransferase